MATDTATRIRPTCTVALELASAALLDALLDAEMGEWATVEQTYDAALRIMEGARLLPRHAAATVIAETFPLLVWNADADGWEPSDLVRRAVRGSRTAAEQAIDLATA